MKKRILSLFLAFVMLFSVIGSAPVHSFAAAQLANESVYFQNPFYSGEEIPTGGIDSEVTKASETATYGSVTYYSKGKKLYETMRNALEKRQNTLKLYYLSNSEFAYRSQVNELLSDLFYNATEDELSVSCTDGDYIRWQFFNATMTFRLDYSKKSKYYYTLTLNLNYNDTAEQEKKVDEVVNKFVASIDRNKLSDYQVIKKVHDFVCNKTTYDYDAVEYAGYPQYLYAFSAYGALCKGLCVCQGYALAFYRICKELGYSVRFVSSDLHAWNIIRLDSKYYFVDCTWDDTDKKEDNYKPVYDYFLLDYDDLTIDDSIYSEHTLEDFYETDYFYDNYRDYFAVGSYDKDADNILSTCTIALSKNTYAYTGSAFQPKVTVTTSSGELLESGVDYKVTYSTKTAPGQASIKITGLGDYKSSASYRPITIKPAKMKTPTIPSSSRTNSSVTLQWQKAAGVTGYIIQQYKSGAWKTIKTITSASTTSYKVSSLAASSTYKFRIAAYKTVSKQNIIGAYSDTLVACTKPKTPAVAKLTTKSKTVTASWKKITCSGYELQYSTNSSMKGAKTIKLSSAATSKKITSLKKGKRYYVRIRAYKSRTTTAGKVVKYYTAWSAKKSIVCK